MNKLLAILIGSLLALSAQAQINSQAQAKPQPREQAGSSANTAPIGQAVSGHNSTAAGVSGTGLHTDGSATTGSAHGAIGQQAAGVNSAGKVIGSSALALGQIVLIAVAAALSLMLTGQDVLLTDLGPAALWFLVFFAVGFVLLAAMFAASAALVSRMEDVGTVIQPVTWLVMLPYFLIIFFNDNETVLTVMSYVPFSAPVGMPVRIFLEQYQWWEPLVALGILAATTVVIVQLGARMYRNSLLRTGARVPLAEALRG